MNQKFKVKITCVKVVPLEKIFSICHIYLEVLQVCGDISFPSRYNGQSVFVVEISSIVR